MLAGMKDPGLQQALASVGSVSALADRLGISQPAVSGWSRVPAERVLAVEAASGVSREVLRPDLYEAAERRRAATGARDGVDEARAQEYRLLGLLLRQAPTADLLARLSRIKGDPSPLGLAHLALADAAAATDAREAGREFFRLFVGVTRGELVPYGSYYQTGFLHERPLARVREDFVRFGIARSDVSHEPEDHVGILCEVMAGLIDGSFDAPAGADKEFFERHLRPFAARFFADLEASSAVFYKSVAVLGGQFIEIETEAFALPV